MQKYMLQYVFNFSPAIRSYYRRHHFLANPVGRNRYLDVLLSAPPEAAAVSALVLRNRFESNEYSYTYSINV